MRKLWNRILSLLLVLALLTPAVFAAESGEETPAFRETRPPTSFTMGPQWTEMEVKVQSGDNTLRGTLTTPKEITGQMPVAILLHGLNTDRHWCDDIAWCLAENGIASVRFDFDGNGLSDGASTDMTIGTETADVLAILDYVEGLRFTDPENIFLVGKSMGAVAALLASEGREEEINALCMWYPGFGVVADTRFGYFLGQQFYPWAPPETLEIAGYTYGRDFLTEAQQLDLVPAIEGCELPVLIIHGDWDPICPLFFSIWANDHFPDSELQVIRGGMHGFMMMQELQALGRMLEFFEEHIV